MSILSEIGTKVGTEFKSDRTRLDTLEAVDTSGPVLSLGVKDCPSGRTTITTEPIQVYGTYNSSTTPIAYGEIISFGINNSRRGEILVSWSGSPRLFIRSLRDCCDNWTAWKEIV